MRHGLESLSSQAFAKGRGVWEGRACVCVCEERRISRTLVYNVQESRSSVFKHIHIFYNIFTTQTRTDFHARMRILTRDRRHVHGRAGRQQGTVVLDARRQRRGRLDREIPHHRCRRRGSAHAHAARLRRPPLHSAEGAGRPLVSEGGGERKGGVGAARRRAAGWRRAGREAAPR